MTIKSLKGTKGRNLTVLLEKNIKISLIIYTYMLYVYVVYSICVYIYIKLVLFIIYLSIEDYYPADEGVYTIHSNANKK